MGVNERWAKPYIPAAVETRSDSLWIEETADGPIPRGDYDHTMKPEDFQRFREGRLCLRCWEPQEEGFAEFEKQNHLPGCSYDIRERQLRDLELEVDGYKHIGPSKPMQDYLDQNYDVRENTPHFDPRTGRPTGGGFSVRRKPRRTPGGIIVPEMKMAIPKGKRR